MNLDYVTRKSETKPHFHNLLDLYLARAKVFVFISRKSETGCASSEEMGRYHAVRNAIALLAKNYHYSTAYNSQ